MGAALCKDLSAARMAVPLDQGKAGYYGKGYGNTE